MTLQETLDIPFSAMFSKIMARQNLTEQEAAQAMRGILSGAWESPQVAAFLVALRMKGETQEEIAGCAQAMREAATRIKTPAGRVVVDTCGTGGDGSGTFNVSTTAAFIVAGTGVLVAKHGNRSISSACGSADVLEALGINILLSPPQMESCLEKGGMAFLFAPTLHPAMKNAAPIRKSLGIRTIFNLLGPLTNPAHVSAQVVGVYDRGWLEPFCHVLNRLGVRHAFVVHGEGAADELVLSGTSWVAELEGGKVRLFTVTPEEMGLKRASLSELRGGDASQNVEIIQSVLNGEVGPYRDVAVLNAAAALVVSGKVSQWKEGIQVAQESIDSGQALKTLETLKRLSHELSDHT